MLKYLSNIISRQYFRYKVMTGTYMLNSFELFLLHSFLLIIFLLCFNYFINSFKFTFDLIKFYFVSFNLIK